MKQITPIVSFIFWLHILTGCHSNNFDANIRPQSDTAVNNRSVSSNSERGIITGNLSYPTDAGVPTDYKVAAINLETGEIFTTDSLDLDFKKNVYQLKVKPGKYNVYSFLSSTPEQKAYYDDFVTCGLNANCHSHEKITVEISSGETKDKIDPADWYVFTK